MRRLLILNLVLAAVVLSAKDKKPDVPGFVAHATNVMVTTFHGNSASNPANHRHNQGRRGRALV